MSTFTDITYKGNVKVIDYDKYSIDKFERKFELLCRPCVILNATSKWKANEKWNTLDLCKNYNNEKFKIGEDDDGDNVYLSMKYFLHYSFSEEGLKDDSPLYIFDSGFAERKSNNTADSLKNRKKNKNNEEINGNGKRKLTSTDKKYKSLSPSTLLEDFEVPKYFTDDLFQLAGERRRPPYRWMVIGGARSGTGIHQDPLGTSAWNALVTGHKRWILFPPNVSKEIVDPGRLGDREGITWFVKMWDKFQQPSAVLPGKTFGEELGMISFVQGPNEVVFVPSGWYHCVINCDFTIAVTQNFCSFANLDIVWLKTRNSRPKLANKILKELKRLSEKENLKDRNIPRSLRHHSADKFKKCIKTLQELSTIPDLFTSSSDSSSSSSSSFSSSDGDNENFDTESESDVNGTCFCKKCKILRKKRVKLLE
ncbi:jumonji domain-containing protein 6 [Clydaea vesicula]|uniref:Jumonji domain-containing protein 6 n=1 Tax=Clydaea vesicula TaxID=447962 RepID=A0AAD5Y0Y6_9FUNG|nr:jumonji domain-containing protein 6 [Clydaea vesicula]